MHTLIARVASARAYCWNVPRSAVKKHWNNLSTHRDSAFPIVPTQHSDNAATNNKSNAHSISNLHLTHPLTKRHNLPRAIVPCYSRPLSDYEPRFLDQRVDGVQSRGVYFDEDLACSGGGYGTRFEREWGGGGGEKEGGLGLWNGGGHCCYCYCRYWTGWTNGDGILKC